MNSWVTLYIASTSLILDISEILGLPCQCFFFLVLVWTVIFWKLNELKIYQTYNYLLFDKFAALRSTWHKLSWTVFRFCEYLALIVRKNGQENFWNCTKNLLGARGRSPGEFFRILRIFCWFLEFFVCKAENVFIHRGNYSRYNSFGFSGT